MARVFQCSLLLLLLFVSGIAADVETPAPSILKYEEPRALTATIYSLDRKTVLFKFSRHSTRSGGQLETICQYSYPDGQMASRERMIYNGDDLQDYELEQLQSGGHGHATIKSDPNNPGRKLLSLEYSRDSASRGSPGRNVESLRNDTLTHDMVGAFLASHWGALLKGEDVKCRYIVMMRKETVGFRFVKEGESQWQGKPQNYGSGGGAASGSVPIVLVRMEPTSPIIRALIEPLHFKIEKEGAHHVLEYTGRTTPRIKLGAKWEDLDAVTVFDW